MSVRPAFGGVVASLGCLVPLLVAGVYFHLTEEINVMMFGDPLGPRAFPRLITGILVVSAILWLLETLAARRRRGLAPEEAPETPWLAICVVAGFILYIATLETLGFVAGSTLFLLAMLAKFHPGKWVTTVAVALLVPIGAHLLFVELLSVPLPVSPILGF